MESALELLAFLTEDERRAIQFSPAIERMCNCELWLRLPGFEVRARHLLAVLDIRKNPL